jgi:hypothetical protein
VRFAGVLALQEKTAITGGPPGPDNELLKPSFILSSHHKIYEISGEADEITIDDFSFVYGIDGLLDRVMSHNKITLDDTIYGEIFGFGVQDSQVLNNKISGTGPMGIYMSIGLHNFWI